jgi:integral membrane protein (TIGR00529 family)
MLIGLGLVISLGAILLVARRNLPLALFCGALILGIFTLPLFDVLRIVAGTLSDASVMLLALAMGVIPMIGGSMTFSGQMDDLVNNLRIGKRGLMAFSPAIMGLLPMPGGALLSAPILEKGGVGVADDLKVAINNWFRHLFVMIYPLSSALIASAKIANLSVYNAMVYLLPTFFFALLLGYLFLIRKIKGVIEYEREFSVMGLVLPLIVVLVAPIIDFTLKTYARLPVDEIATVVGVTTAFALSLILSRVKLDLWSIAKRMKPWNFALIIIAMFIFLNIFKASNAATLIASIPLPPVTLCVVAGFILGLTTGRVLLPASIILPVYLTFAPITPVVFALIYTNMFFGYVISPVHPCVCVSLEYFNASMKGFLKLLLYPTLMIFLIVLLVSLFLL